MNTNDPRLTAHALGEADAESAGLIAQDATLATEAAQIQRFAQSLRAELQAEPALPLRDEQRAAIFAAANIVTGPARWWQRGATIGAAAACAVLALGAAIYFQARHLDRLRPVAGAKTTAPQSVSVRWVDEGGQPRIEPVLAPKAPAVETRPSYLSPVPTIVHTSEPAKLPTTKPFAESVPTLVAGSTPAPVAVDPSSVPMSGTLPADRERTSAAPLRAGSKPPLKR